MASIQFGGGVAQVRGSLNGTVFARNKNGAYARNRVKGTNPRSEAQVAQRVLFSSLSSAWRDLTPAQRQTWIDGAEKFPYTNRVGEVSVLSGAQLFNKLNMALLSAGANRIDSCPTPAKLPDFKVLNVELIVLSGEVDTFAFTVPSGALPAGFRLQAFASVGVSAGRTTNSTRKRLIASVVGSGQTSIDLAPGYIATYSAPSVGSNVILELVMVNATTGQSLVVYSSAVPVA